MRFFVRREYYHEREHISQEALPSPWNHCHVDTCSGRRWVSGFGRLWTVAWIEGLATADWPVVLRDACVQDVLGPEAVIV